MTIFKWHGASRGFSDIRNMHINMYMRLYH